MTDVAGNVRVYVRCRPLLSKEIVNQKYQKCVSFDRTNKRRILVGNGKEFNFDHIYDDESKQDEIYTDCVKPLVEGNNNYDDLSCITVFRYRLLSGIQCNRSGREI